MTSWTITAHLCWTRSKSGNNQNTLKVSPSSPPLPPHLHIPRPSLVIVSRIVVVVPLDLDLPSAPSPAPGWPYPPYAQQLLEACQRPDAGFDRRCSCEALQRRAFLNTTHAYSTHSPCLTRVGPLLSSSFLHFFVPPVSPATPEPRCPQR